MQGHGADNITVHNRSAELGIDAESCVPSWGGERVDYAPLVEALFRCAQRGVEA